MNWIEVIASNKSGHRNIAKWKNRLVYFININTRKFKKSLPNRISPKYFPEFVRQVKWLQNSQVNSYISLLQ